MGEVYIVSGCRTAIGSFGGSLKDIPAAELGAIVLREAVSRAGLEPDAVDEVNFGCVLDGGLGQNVARQAALKAGLLVETPAATVKMVCGSGLRSVIDGVRSILAGDAQIAAAGGTENMSAAAYVLASGRWGGRMGHQSLTDTMITDGLWDAFNDYHMGVTAENVAREYELTREELDTFALASQKKAQAAQDAGAFQEEIVPVEIRRKKETLLFDKDEYPRDTSIEALAKLRPAFQKDGVVTAGNASGINDGAAALLLASGEAVQRYGLKPMAKIIGWGQAGVDPAIMGVGPVEASRKAMAKAGVSIGDIDLVEANEAFAAQSLAVAQELGFDMSKVNVNGGAIALGHPIGASGARILVTLLHELRRRADARRGLATLCVGGGMGVSVVVEKV